MHETRDGGYWLAPFYMATVLMGMAGVELHLVDMESGGVGCPPCSDPVPPTTCMHMHAGLIVLPQWLAERPSAMAEPLITSGEKDVASPSPPRSLRLPLVNNTVGYALAALAGLLSATQYALVTLGKRVVASPQALDPLGSWTASFGLGWTQGLRVRVRVRMWMWVKGEDASDGACWGDGELDGECENENECIGLEGRGCCTGCHCRATHLATRLGRSGCCQCGGRHRRLAHLRSTYNPTTCDATPWLSGRYTVLRILATGEMSLSLLAFVPYGNAPDQARLSLLPVERCSGSVLVTADYYGGTARR